MSRHDVFRPRRQPAQTLYDAFQAEARKRKGRTVENWMTAETQVVWAAACDYAQQHGLAEPTLAQVEAASKMAAGHTDYGAQWAYAVEKIIMAGKPAG